MNYKLSRSQTEYFEPGILLLPKEFYEPKAIATAKVLRVEGNWCGKDFGGTSLQMVSFQSKSDLKKILKKEILKIPQKFLAFLKKTLA